MCRNGDQHKATKGPLIVRATFMYIFTHIWCERTRVFVDKFKHVICHGRNGTLTLSLAGSSNITIFRPFAWLSWKTGHKQEYAFGEKTTRSWNIRWMRPLRGFQRVRRFKTRHSGRLAIFVPRDLICSQKSAFPIVEVAMIVCV